MAIHRSCKEYCSLQGPLAMIKEVLHSNIKVLKTVVKKQHIIFTFTGTAHN